MKREIALGKEFYTVAAHRHGDTYTTTIGENDALSARLEHVEGIDYNVVINGAATPVKLVAHGEQMFIHAFGRNFELNVIDPVDRAAEQSGSTSVFKAPMPGIMVEINVEPGQQVTAGEPLISIESMKIMMVIKAWRDGEVEAVNFAEGEAFDKNAVLVSMVEEECEEGEQN
ncbi:MAG: biotin/lipoyl-containing protein [Motiliproteus sp.]